MKRTISIMLLLLFGFIHQNKALSNLPPENPVSPAAIIEPPVSVSFSVFYDELSPYGSWVSYPSYGYVWVPGPSIGVGFTPYCHGGHWVYTDMGWTWASDYSWGWAPFHYGRWAYDDSYGWLWVPGYDWAPAWVTWGSYDTYYGWAPLGPGITFYAGYRPPPHYWTFVPVSRVTEVNIINYRVQNTTVVNNVTVINNSATYNSKAYHPGPPPTAVEKATGKKVNTVMVAESAKPGATTVQGNHLAVYRPTIAKAATGKEPAPAKVEKLENLKKTGTVNGKGVTPAAPAGGVKSPEKGTPANGAKPPAANSGKPGSQPGREKPLEQKQPANGAKQPMEKPREQKPPVREKQPQPTPPNRERAPVNSPPSREKSPPMEKPHEAMPPNRATPPERHAEPPVRENPQRPPMERPHEQMQQPPAERRTEPPVRQNPERAPMERPHEQMPPPNRPPMERPPQQERMPMERPHEERQPHSLQNSRRGYEPTAAGNSAMMPPLMRLRPSRH